MSTLISGILKNANGQPMPNVGITLTSLRTNHETIISTETALQTSPDGSYSFDVVVGTYSVSIGLNSTSKIVVGQIRIFMDSIPGTLEDFLTIPGVDEVTPEILAQVIQARYDAVTAAQTAADDATSIINQQLSDQESRFQQFLLSSGYQFLGDYESGPYMVTALNQIIRYQNELWRLNASTTPPYTTAGVNSASWATDVTHLVSVGDAALRQDLASFSAGKGSSLVRTTIDDKDVQQILDAPSIITGRVNIANPRWNAPRDNAEDPAAASANAAAINMMLSAGGKHIELDDKARRVNTPLFYRDSVAIHGAGRSAISLVWTGGDAPIIARPNYTNKDAAGASNVRLQDLRITDQAATRTSYYTVDLFNGNSNGLERCWIDCPGTFDSGGARVVTSDRYGVALGLARNSTLSGSSGFVSHMRGSRITRGTLMINGTDWYVSGCELWGDFRNRAVEISAGGTIDGGTQIVPGAEAGIFLFSDVGYDIDTLKLLGVYFDGSTDTTLFTGWGIKSANGVGLVSAEILGCDFWHINQGGILVSKLYSSTIHSNFRDCDSDDTGEDDIKCDDFYGSYIYNRHFRNTAPKKLVGGVEQARANLGKPFTLTAKSGYPLSSVGGEVSYSNAYARCSVSNPTYVNSLGGSFLTTFPYGALPNASAMYGKTVMVNGKLYYSDGSVWRDLTRDPIVLSTATDLHLLPYSHNYFASDITIHSNIPSGVTGAANIDYQFASAGYATLTLTLLKASGGIYTQSQSAGIWGAWVKVA